MEELNSFVMDCISDRRLHHLSSEQQLRKLYHKLQCRYKDENHIRIYTLVTNSVLKITPEAILIFDYQYEPTSQCEGKIIIVYENGYGNLKMDGLYLERQWDVEKKVSTIINFLNQAKADSHCTISFTNDNCLQILWMELKGTRHWQTYPVTRRELRTILLGLWVARDKDNRELIYIEVTPQNVLRSYPLNFEQQPMAYHTNDLPTQEDYEKITGQMHILLS